MQNIVFITVDSLRADHLGCYGYDRETSPNIDALAADESLFRNAFSHAGATRTSFQAIMTGVHPRFFGDFYTLSEERTLVSEPLSEAGYMTAGFNSNPYLADEFGYGRGFDRLYDWSNQSSLMAKARQVVKDNLNRDGVLYRLAKKTFGYTERKTGVELGSLYTPADELTNAAIKWINDNPGDGTFLWIHYMDVHHPYVPPARFQRKIGGGVTDERDALKLRRKLLETPEAATEEEWTEARRLYDAEIRFTDHHIGKLVDHARATWGSDTKVIFTADHGEEFNEHGRFGHQGTFYDELIHVPLIAPITPGETYDEVIALVDLAPTILDYAGVTIPESYLGHSLQQLRQTNEWPRDAVVSRIDDKVFYRDDTWKYIRYGETEELYDVADDPDETRDRIHSEPEVLHRITSALDTHPVDTEGPTADGTEDVEMSSEMQDRLRALGYKE